MPDKTAANGTSPDIKCVGVIGAGQMGGGIAHVCALAGYDVRISDVGKEQLEKAVEIITANMERQVKNGLISKADMKAALKRISTGTSYSLFKGCDVIIESATENEEVKREILKKLCPVIKPEAIVCTNTSSISITRLAAVPTGQSGSWACTS